MLGRTFMIARARTAWFEKQNSAAKPVSMEGSPGACMRLSNHVLTRPRSLNTRPWQLRLLRLRALDEWLFWASMFAIFALCLYLCFRYVEPSIAGLSEIRIGADSDHYWEAVDLQRSGNGKTLVSFTGNFLGPTLIGLVFQTGFGVLCFNFGLLALAWKTAEGIPYLRKAVFGLLLVANAEIIPSLATLNKEILTLFASVLTVLYLTSQKRSWLLLFSLLSISIIALWEQAVFLFMLLGIEHSRLRRHPWTTIFLLTILITVGYPFAFQLLGIDPATFDDILAGANTVRILNSLQNSFLFPLVVLPKIAMLTLGRLAQQQFYLAN